MKNDKNLKVNNELAQLCKSVRAFVIDGIYEPCFEPICRAMEQFPHSPEPHNLLGVVLEKRGDHLTAMKHFRAALALDPTYLPATHNLNIYGTFFSGGACAFDESDVPDISENDVEVQYDKRGIGHIVHKTKIEYDENGVGRAIRR